MFGCFLVLSAVLLWRKAQVEDKPLTIKAEGARG